VILGAEIVEWDQILEVVYTAAGAGLALAVAFSAAVAGATRFNEERRAGSGVRAAGFGAIAFLGLTVCAAAIVLGIVAMVDKR
jgi:predicted permease